MAMTSCVENEDQTFYITLGDKEIFSTFAENGLEVKQWITQIEKQYLNKSKRNKKQPPLVVGLWADRSIDYIDGRKTLYPKDTKLFRKLAPYELLVVCVGNQCLLWILDPEIKRYSYSLKEGFIPNEVPKALKNFLSSSQIMVVGFGINAMVKKLENETNLLFSKQMELRDLVQEKLELVPGEFAKCSQESLVKLAMGPEWKVLKPDPMIWECGETWEYETISAELARYVSTEAFVAAEMASKLLKAEAATQIREKLRKLKLKKKQKQ